MWRQGQPNDVNLVKAPASLINSQRQQEVNDEIFRHVQEMFKGKVDADVVFIILQELDWNVEKAIDSLCNMCGSKIDASKKTSKLAEIARDVLCLDKKNKSPQQSTQNLMPSEFPVLGSQQPLDRPVSGEPSPTAVDSTRIDKKSPLRTNSRRDKHGNASTNLNNSGLSTSSADNIGKSPSAFINQVDTSPKHVGVIGEKFQKRSKDNSKYTGNVNTESREEKHSRNIIKPRGRNFADPSREMARTNIDKYSEGEMMCFPSFHDKKSSNNIGLDHSQLLSLKSNQMQSSHNSLDDIDDNFEEELEFTSKSEVNPLAVSPISHGIGHSILAGALNLTSSIQSELPTPTEEKFPMHSSQVSPILSVSTTPVSSMWLHARDKREIPVESKYVLSGFSSTQETSRYSFANKSAFNSRHDSGDFDIDSLLKEGTFGNIKESDAENLNKDVLNYSIEVENSSQESFDLLEVENRETMERPKSTEMQLPVVSFELSVSAKEFIPRLQKEDDVKQVDEETGDLQPHFVMPKMGKPSPEGVMPHPRMQNQFVPGFRQQRPPFPMPVRPPWPPRGVRGPMPRGIPPWMHFHNFPEPRTAPPFLPPGGVLPVHRNSKSLTESNEKAIERVKQKTSSGTKLLIILRGLPGSGKSTLAKELVADGTVLSTDDFFMENGLYNHDANKLTDAHEWNRKRAAAAMEEKITPIIIDNTNTQAWEMKPYLKLGKAFHYEMEMLEPATPWKYSVKELTRRTVHGVPKEHIQRMKDRYQRDLCVETILGVPVKRSQMSENGDKPKDVEFSHADFPELRNSLNGGNSPFNSPRKDSIDQEVFFSRPEEFKEEEQHIKRRKNSADSYLECSTPGSDTDSEKRIEKEFDQLSDSRNSPIPGNIGFVARSHVGMSTTNLHKQLEIISKRKTLMSPPVLPVSHGKKEDTSPVSLDNSTASLTSTSAGIPSEGDDVEKMVDSLILENVGSCWSEDSDQDKIIDELKSLILFMPIDPTQHLQYEKMIEEKIKKLAEKSKNKTVICQDADSVKEDDTGGSTLAEVTTDSYVWDTPNDSEVEGKSENLLNSKSTAEIPFSEEIMMTESLDTAECINETANNDAIKISESSYWNKHKENEVDSTEVWEDVEKVKVPRPQRKMKVKQRIQKSNPEENDIEGLTHDDNEISHNSITVELKSEENTSYEAVSDSAKNMEVQTIPPEKQLAVCGASRNSLHPENEKENEKSLKKNPKRKMAAKFPLFNESDRAKFSVNDWTSIKVDKLDEACEVIMKSVEDEHDVKVVIKVDSETEITPHDLKIMYELGNRGVGCEQLDNVLIIEGKDWKVGKSNASTYNFSNSSTVLTKHRSTMTEDLLDADIEFLKNSFPTIPEVDLKEVLQNCDNNVEWAADIILDWNFHDLSLTQEDKNHYLDSIFKLQRIPKSPTIPVRSRNSPSLCVEELFKPTSLVDICMNFLEDTNIATKEDIENQLIANSEKRLLSYESNIRICNQFSRGNEGDEIFIEDDDFNNEILQELVALTEKETTSDNDSLLHVLKTDQSLNSYTVPSQSQATGESIDCGPTVESGVVSLHSRESPPNFAVHLNLPADFIQALLSLFGSIGKLTSETAEALTIPVDYTTAQRLHQCLRTEYVENHLSKSQQISQDEALAQQLHSEINESHVKNETSLSLHAIMDEQLQEERKKKELRDDLKASGYQNTIGNRMKKQKLYEEFPAIDSFVLDEIFQANCFSYEDTVKAVQGSLGYNEPPRTVMTAEAADEYERKLIEAAKQQSLREMIDSFSYRPKIKKEFQSAENPEYEDIRGEANLHYRLRHECFQKAQEAYRRGMKQVANFYSNQGHLHTKKIKEANENAAQMILSQRDKYLETKSTLDLHGLHVDEAVTVLTKVIEDQITKLSVRGDKKKDVFIITGRGSHSRGGVARIRPAVIRWLKQKAYNYTEVHEGLLKLRLPQ